LEVTSWSARFYERLNSFGIDTGLHLRRVGGVSEFKIMLGSASARVQESPRQYYEVWIDVQAFNPAEWARVERGVAANSEYLAQILNGELPADIDEFFARLGLPLLPARRTDLSLDCSCPNSVPPCHHIGAVLDSLAEIFDSDPFALLAWRGRSRARLLRHINELGLSPADEPVGADPGSSQLSDCLAVFWVEGMPSTGQNRSRPAVPALDRLGRINIAVRGRNIADLLGPAYEAFHNC